MQPRYSADEIVRRGQQWYDEQIGQRIEEGNLGKYVLIDVETGDYRVGSDYQALTRQILSLNPESTLCVLRIGHPAVGRIGGRSGTRRQ